MLDQKARSINTFAGSGKPGQADGALPSFYEPGGLTIANDKLYVADTNNHAIRVVDLKTKETKTLPIKGLQPPQASQAAAGADVAPNAQEIKLSLQRVRAGQATLLIDVELPASYHLNPTAPQRYQVSVENGSQTIAIDVGDATRNTKGLQLPIRVPMRASHAGTAELRASFT